MGQRSYQEMVEEQKKGMPPVTTGDLTGKTVMITGANSGIGFEAAKHFATMNPTRLIVVCRSVEKAQDSIAKIEADTGYKGAEPMGLELSSFRSVSEFVTQVNKTLDRLDIIVENAAISTNYEYIATDDGWESMLQVNSLGPALHTLLLLPIISNTAKQHSVVPRIVVVSSETIFMANIDSDAIAAANTLQTLSSKDYCTPGIMRARYVHSKILNVMLVNKLAALLPQNIVPVALNPGFCVSGLRRKSRGEEAERFKKMEDDFAYTSEEGSRQIIYAAIGGKDEELRGKFTSYSQVLEISDWMLSEEGKKAEDKTWNEMLEIFGKLDERVPQIVAEYLKV
ncbi:MAG: hypothetical protein NXY57DRAFT_1001009 [Lentinula lateritia]|uniref:Short-chain dehydrogenase n=1 Tax=Lentinula lateritia TaxID=40482 RepID=A0ABQ8V936_9AGAR|nr:hypothetical protein EV359DRAFT_82293 [Lentinula novae-zelandiae]KAJ3932880.1 MAG: hypothetical protein NXY57DRAFT_1001009 [Lentinula lateritia]KAJ4474557.1 short-chain dehydrogenase [Lentinula lateritia]